MKRPANWLRLVIGVALAGTIVWVLTGNTEIDPAAIERRVAALGAWAPVGFIAFYGVAAVLFMPGLVMALAGGALFGPVWGVVYNAGGAILGATLAFLVARYLASDWVRRLTQGWLRQVIDGVDAEGWRFVAFVRLVPLFPFNLLNYALGLTGIPLRAYVLASLVCMLPGTIAYTWLGYVGRAAAVGGKDLEDVIWYGLVALGLVALVAFLPRVVRRIRARR
jgi:uncharacterized membrane protein YdjX (TVP38/TMEM64 family)